MNLIRSAVFCDVPECLLIGACVGLKRNLAWTEFQFMLFNVNAMKQVDYLEQ